MERSGTGSRQRRASSTVQKLRLGDHNVVARDRISNASFMDVSRFFLFFLLLGLCVFEHTFDCAVHVI